MRYSLCVSALVAAVTAVALPQVSQISDGQIQAPTGSPVQQISDGQLQQPTASASPVQQISDGQLQQPTGSPVQQISDGQLQQPTGSPVQQISDGQIQQPTGSPVQQISDGQIQQPTGSPVQQISDGQIQQPTGSPVQQISDGQIQQPTGSPVQQISDGQIQQPTGSPVQQISDGQIQQPTGSPVQQISDGQIQQPTGSPVQQISDGQIQQPTGSPVQQISDGQIQQPTGSPVQQISDGQIQAPTGSPVQQISDGQIQAPTGSPVQQISDGQVQAPTGKPVQQISDGQIQAPTGSPVQQISDGQIQAPTGKPVQQISDGQIQAPTGSPVQQISDGQIQAPTGSPVQQISDGQIQAPTGKPVQQISDGQIQQPAAGGAPASKAAASAYSPPSGYGSYNPAGGAAGPQVPFKFPLDNGFPNIMVPSSELTAIQKQAHGTIPNGPLPKKLSDASATNFQLIAFNEIFEVAYFTSLLKNITSGEYDAGKGAAKDFVVQSIAAIQAQEELHALGANAILSSAGRTPVMPCEYKFPATDFDTAIATASLFTDVVLGTLQAAQTTFATTGDDAVVGLIGSVIGQEGEQNGYYRASGKKIPSALPFLTGGSGAFAFSALNQLFVVPGTCGNLDAIDIPILQPLTVVTPPAAADSDVTYSYPVDPSITDPSGLRLVLINQQNVPIVQELENIKLEGNTVTFTSPFPYTNATLNGLTIAAVTNGATSFASPDEVAAAAVWGPGLIEVN